MYRVHVRQHFDAAHGLRGYRGKCENLHGHRWEVVACVESETLNEIGLSLDFSLLKAELRAILSCFDHCNLNEVPPFDQINPSSENIARTIYHELKRRLPESDIEHIEVWESPDAWVSFRED